MQKYILILGQYRNINLPLMPSVNVILFGINFIALYDVQSVLKNLANLFLFSFSLDLYLISFLANDIGISFVAALEKTLSLTRRFNYKIAKRLAVDGKRPLARGILYAV